MCLLSSKTQQQKREREPRRHFQPHHNQHMAPPLLLPTTTTGGAALVVSSVASQQVVADLTHQGFIISKPSIEQLRYEKRQRRQWTIVVGSGTYAWGGFVMCTDHELMMACCCCCCCCRAMHISRRYYGRHGLGRHGYSCQFYLLPCLLFAPHLGTLVHYSTTMDQQGTNHSRPSPIVSRKCGTVDGLQLGFCQGKWTINARNATFATHSNAIGRNGSKTRGKFTWLESTHQGKWWNSKTNKGLCENDLLWKVQMAHKKSD